MKKICNFFCDFRNLGLSVSGISIAALGFAYTLQYAFNKLPCPLCYIQRYPYMINIVLGLLAAVLARKAPKLAVAVLMLSGLAFLAGAGVASFHIGVEQGWWEGLKTCGGGVGPPQGVSIEELQKYFEHAPIVDCRRAGWSFLGVSMTEQNFLASLFLAFFTFFHGMKGRSHGKKA